MTQQTLKRRLLSALSLAALGSAAMFLPASAMASETAPTTVAAPTEFQISAKGSGLIKSGMQAYRKGNFAKSIAYNKAMLRTRPNKRKRATAQSNLCASYAMLEDYVSAETACNAALALRPDHALAHSNAELLRIKLAQK